jgi:hypothetical protein
VPVTVPMDIRQRQGEPWSQRASVIPIINTSGWSCCFAIAKDNREATVRSECDSLDWTSQPSRPAPGQCPDWADELCATSRPLVHLPGALRFSLDRGFGLLPGSAGSRRPLAKMIRAKSSVARSWPPKRLRRRRGHHSNWFNNFRRRRTKLSGVLALSSAMTRAPCRAFSCWRRGSHRGAVRSLNAWLPRALMVPWQSSSYRNWSAKLRRLRKIIALN